MSYEQLMEMGDRAGKVNKGLTKMQIEEIVERVFMPGRTRAEECHVCMDQFKLGEKYKELKCRHEYHSKCIDQWLVREKRCPVCSKDAV